MRRSSHFPALVGFSVFMVFLSVMPKVHGNFTPKQIIVDLILSACCYGLTYLFQWIEDGDDGYY